MGVGRWLVVMTAIVLTAAGARAQTRKSLPVDAAQYARLCDRLDLTADQRTAAKLVYEAYASDFKIRMDALTDAEERCRAAMKEHADDASERRHDMETIISATDDFLRERNHAETRVMADLRSILTADQAERLFPGAERAQRRERLVWIHGQLAQWCSLDLFKAVEHAGVSWADRTAIEPMLARYDVELDIPLKGWLTAQEQFDDLRPRARRMRGEDVDVAGFLSKRDDWTRRLAAVNRRAAQEMIATLPEPAASAVRKEVRESVYRLSADHADERALLEHAAKLAGLTDEQRVKLEGVRAWHEQSAAAYDQWRVTSYDRIEAQGESDARAKDTEQMLREEADRGVKLRGELRAKLDAILTSEQRRELQREAKSSPAP